MSSRVLPVSEAELARRRKTVREHMERAGLDLLLVNSNSRIWSGSLRYLTSYLSVSAFPEYLLFDVEGKITFIGHYGIFSELAKLFGIDDIKHIPTNPSRSYKYDAQYICSEIRERNPSALGIVGFDTLSSAFYAHLTKEFPSLSMQDAGGLLLEVRMLKSREEIELCEKCASLTDLGMDVALKTLKSGKTENEIMRAVDQAVKEVGSEQQFYLAGSGPPGVQIRRYGLHMWNRVLHDGDILRLLIEISGPGGYWTEVSRAICLGSVPREIEAAFDVAHKAQLEAAKMLKPGARLSEVYQKANHILIESGYQAQTKSLFGHGQGLELVEKPIIHPDESIEVKAGMNLAIHPTATGEKAIADLCDNFLVEEGGSRRLQKTPQEVLIV